MFMLYIPKEYRNSEIAGMALNMAMEDARPKGMMLAGADKTQGDDDV